MCAICEDKQTILSKEFPWAIYEKVIGETEWSVFIDRGYLRLADKEDCNCLDHGEKYKIIFCPICGRDLTID